MTKTNKDMPSVLAFEKKLAPSDGFMYGTTWDRRNEKAPPLKLIEKSVRGTISHRLPKTDIDNDPAKLNHKITNPNPQTVDSCSLNENQDTLKLEFTLKVLSGVQNPSACDKDVFSKDYERWVEKYIEKYGFEKLAHRYVTNIANARFLWRNRVGAEKIEVLVKVLNEDMENEEIKKEYSFDAKTINIKDFDSENKDLKELAQETAKALSGKREFLLLGITAFAKVGKSQEVYPSEELVMDKGKGKDKGKKNKILYSVNERAALHSQKIGNALRTIDTWYPADSFDSGIGPIAVEPYGSVTNRGMAYRNPTKKEDFYTLLDECFKSKKDLNEEQQHYLMAVLVRGGVFGKSDKE